MGGGRFARHCGHKYIDLDVHMCFTRRVHQEEDAYRRLQWGGPPAPPVCSGQTTGLQGVACGSIGGAFTTRPESDPREPASLRLWPARSPERLRRTGGLWLLMHAQLYRVQTPDERSRSEVPISANRAQRARSCIAALLQAVSVRGALIQGDRMPAWDGRCQLSTACGRARGSAACCQQHRGHAHRTDE